MPSPHRPNEDAAALKTYLESAIPSSHLSDASVNPKYEPLLLMQAHHLLAGFAFSNGDMRKSYALLYEGFKKYCDQKETQLEALDLAFVFCIQPGGDDPGGFCSSIETDVYFCRKFVVELVAPLESALARLPFLPLTPLDGQTLRAPSAQTFLQRSGVPAVLSQYLVVQGARSPETIVEDCVAGTFGEPRRLSPASTESHTKSEPVGEAIQLESISIENFRAYRKKRTFNIGADVTVLYGPNGFGKTSFFDAMDFGATGGIGRLRSLRDNNFDKTVRHLDSGSEEATVSLSFRYQDVPHRITRTIRNRNHPSLDGRPSDRKAALTSLTGGDISSADRIENFVNLFRATHLFSQEQQELTRHLESDCELPSDIVARMLAYEDYVNASKKTEGVTKHLRSLVSVPDGEKELAQQIADERKELERLNQTARTAARPATVDKDGGALKESLIKLGIAKSADHVTVEAVRRWRAELASTHAGSVARGKRLSELVKDVAELPRAQSDLTTTNTTIEATDKSLVDVNALAMLAATAASDAERKLGEAAQLRLRVQSETAVLDWIRTTAPAYRALEESVRTTDSDVRRATDELGDIRAKQAGSQADIASREASQTSLQETLRSKLEELAALQRLLERLPAWQADTTLLTSVIAQEKQQVTSLAAIRLEVAALASERATVASEVARLTRAISDAEAQDSELSRLLGEIQRFAESGTCPLCGEDHGSRDELLRRIRSHAPSDSAATLRPPFNAARDRLNALDDRIAANAAGEGTGRLEAERLGADRRALDASTKAFQNDLALAGFSISATSPPLSAQLQQLEARRRDEATALEEQLRAERDVVAFTRLSLDALLSSIETSTKRLAEASARRKESQDELAKLKDDPRLTRWNFDSDEASVNEAIKVSTKETTRLSALVEQLTKDVADRNSEAGTHRSQISSLRRQLKDLRSQAALLQRTIGTTTVRLTESGLKPGITSAELLDLITDETRNQTQLRQLSDSAQGIEMALDSTTTAAALAQLARTVQSKEDALAKTATTRDTYRPWVKYFEDLSRLLTSQQNAAVENFTREYGPRTSVIQRRLRSVYGFDDIDIQSKGSAIKVRVLRGNEELRPTDYFSQSQQQTLSLGLFLTACVSQTWSAFSTVFLDDPVTHFDDLNTYAFLDLIVGLLETKADHHQFVISTCDDQLLQLARQKFRHLGERATFYRFSAIGEDGPVVEQITDPGSE